MRAVAWSGRAQRCIEMVNEVSIESDCLGFPAAWEVLKASTPSSLLATAYKAMILRGDND